MTLIPPMHYAKIRNPVCINSKGQPEKTKFGQVKVKLNDTEIRKHSDYPDWFPLYPGEKLDGIFEAIVANATQNIKVRITQEYTEGDRTVGLTYLVLPARPDSDQGTNHLLPKKRARYHWSSKGSRDHFAQSHQT